ncbi:MAG: hypothetical protein WC956_04625 [bacterium]
MKDIFDNLIDSFSSKDLRSRVRAVIAVGLAVMTLAAVGLYYLSAHRQTIAISGSAQWSQEDRLLISLSPEKLQRVADLSEISVEILDPAKGNIQARVRLLSIDPSSSTALIDASALPAELHRLTRMDVKLIVLEKPFWQLLWGK